MKPISSFLFLLIFFASCKKDNTDLSNFTSYLKGKVDGVAFECSMLISANKPEPISGLGDDPTLRISGLWDNGAIKLFILTEGVNIIPKIYNFEADKRRSSTLNYIDGIDYYAGPACFFCTAHLVGSGQITILEITKNYVRGTFNFVTDKHHINGKIKTVTDGEFHIKRQ